MQSKLKIACLLLISSLNFLYCQVTPVSPSIGDGSQSNPYQINVPGNLTWIGSNLGSAGNVYFIQINDIDLTGIDWIPLPDFRGNYDGNGFEIQNMTINRPYDNSNGLFANISWGAEVKNLGISNASVTGLDQNGILAFSINHGNVHITNCYIKNSTINGRNNNGGFSYYAYQTYFEDCYVENITINGENYNGAFSQYFRDSYLDNCFATGTINAPGNYNSGLIEQHHTNSTTIQNSYSRVNLNLTAGSSYVGGLVARVTNGSITNSYYAGTIDQQGSPGGNTGGLFGYPSAGNSSGCFWDSDLTPGLTSGSGRAGYDWGTAKTTTEMYDPNTYSLYRWDFIGESTFGTDDIWEIDNTTSGTKFNDGYPFFSSENGTINTYNPPTEIISAVDVYTNQSTFSTSFSAIHPDGGATSFVINSSDNSIVTATITDVSTIGTTTTGTLNLIYNGANTDDQAELTVTASNPNSIDITTKFNYYYDNTAPTAKLTYMVNNKNRWASSPTETVIITANFYEIPLGTVSISATNWSPFTNQPMTKIDELTYEYSWVVPSGSSSEGFEKFTIATTDRAGNNLGSTYQSTLIIGTLQPTQGNGTVSNPYLVSTPGDLAWIEMGTSNNGGNRADNTYFIQTNNIDLSGLDWVPLFDFRGNYDGNGFEIQNMNINRPYDNSNGLFANISWGAEVKNLGISNASVTGLDQNGILAFSINHGNVHITNCYIKNSTINGRNNNGGFSYYAYQTYFEDCYVENITINGENYNGAFSQYFRDSYLDNCFATGTINAPGNYNSGLIEQHHTNSTTIQNSYSRVNLNLTAGSSYVGGLVARVTNGSITNSYYAGTIDQQGSPGGNTGGLFGYPSAGNSSGCFWDSDLTPGITSGSGRTGYDWGTAKTTTEMKTPSTFTANSWNTDIWSLESNFYPSFNFIDRELPVISAVTLAADNSTITVQMSVIVFNTDSGTGAIESNDFNLSLTGGTATLNTATPSSITIDGTSITLGFSLTGVADGTEILKVNPVTNSIFNIDGMEVAVYQTNNEVTINNASADTDADGVNDALDLCDNTPSGESVDGNGCSDTQKDTDADGVNDALDLCDNTPSGESVDGNGCSDTQKDTDADGVNDALDLCDNTPSGESVDGNGCSDTQKDTDSDGVNDAEDNCVSIGNLDQLDTDSDGEGNVCDTDDDNDDTLDIDDAFSIDPTEDMDSDNDGTGDNADTDDDNDGTLDIYDAFPRDSTEDTDTDGDGTGNNTDLDDDGDGILDADDDFPLDDSMDIDTDGDGIGDNLDTDDDNDGVLDNEDAFPLDPSEDTDTDNDGTGNNADTDDDNDGTLDIYDAFPMDPTEDTDTDGDGIGDNLDTDDDNDGTLDIEDAFSLDSTEDIDTDGDGIGDNLDTDDDNDGTLDIDDAFPIDPTEDMDSDNDGTGNNADTDDDNDGTLDINDAFPFDAEPALIAAEAFTPNGDGINDYWVIPGIESYPNSIVTVYNRWGHEVFAAKGYRNDWNAIYKSNSNKLPPGSYLFIINLGNGSMLNKGWLFINY